MNKINSVRAGTARRTTMDAYRNHGAVTAQSITFGYGGAKGSWQYKSYWCSDARVKITIKGTRANSGDSVEMIVGATSGIFNTYQHRMWI
ncbi:hypothetical protein [Streptomyces sp. NPDC051183]|uniref:hypothetical protein n=1 Tax=Streptomyces sp. NPDC051183 TaxID=3155165 RepID=UPI0034404FDB